MSTLRQGPPSGAAPVTVSGYRSGPLRLTVRRAKDLPAGRPSPNRLSTHRRKRTCVGVANPRGKREGPVYTTLVTTRAGPRAVPVTDKITSNDQPPQSLGLPSQCTMTTSMHIRGGLILWREELESSSRREPPPRLTRGCPLSRRFGTREILPRGRRGYFAGRRPTSSSQASSRGFGYRGCPRCITPFLLNGYHCLASVSE